MTDPLAPIVRANTLTGELVSVDDPAPLPPRLRTSRLTGEYVGRKPSLGVFPSRPNATKPGKAPAKPGRVHMTRRGLEPIDTAAKGEKAAEDATADAKPKRARK